MQFQLFPFERFYTHEENTVIKCRSHTRESESRQVPFSIPIDGLKFNVRFCIGENVSLETHSVFGGQVSIGLGWLHCNSRIRKAFPSTSLIFLLNIYL